jgi:hypothetical protein
MKTLRLNAIVDEKGVLHAEVPHDLNPGAIQIIALIPEGDENEFSDAWIRGIAREWAAELSDPREDIYTLEDGEPVDGPR